MSKEDLTGLLADSVDQTWKSYSMDGSAFESTQHVEIMRIVDDRLYDIYAKLFLREL
jgi:hypothetical protein